MATARTSGEVETGSTRASYSEAGAGEPLVCLAGDAPGASAATDYEANIEALSDRFRVILLELPSFVSAEAGADSLLRALDGLGLDRAHIIGNGFSGEVALRLAAKSPERVSKVVAVGPTGCLFSPFTPSPLEGVKALHAYRQDPTLVRLTEAMRLYVHDNALNSESELASRQERAAAQPSNPTADATDVDMLSVATAVRAPTLLIWGKDDRLSQLDYGLNLLARIQDAQFHLFNQCGHWAQGEHPAEFNSLVEEFLAFGDRRLPGAETLTYEGTGKIADAKGVKVHYHEAGEGEPLIMVSGTGPGATSWGQNRYNIDELALSFRVILYNPPPVGQSDKTLESEGPRNEFYAQILCDFMDELGLDKAHFYGGSPGSTQVIWLALTRPERIDKLILQCAPGVGPSYFTPFPWEGARLTGAAGRNPSHENVTAQIASMVPREDRRAESLFMDRFNNANDTEANEARRRITGPQENLTAELGKIGHETLLIWGINERDVPLDFGLKLAASIPESRLHVYGDETGHFPQFERADEFNILVRRFLQEEKSN